MARLYKVTGEDIDVFPRKKDKGFTLDELYELIECDTVEIVDLSNGKLMVLDEEGKLKGSKLNFFATAIYQSNTGVIDNIVGNALVCGKGEVK